MEDGANPFVVDCGLCEGLGDDGWLEEFDAEAEVDDGVQEACSRELLVCVYNLLMWLLCHR